MFPLQPYSYFLFLMLEIEYSSHLCDCQYMLQKMMTIAQIINLRSIATEAIKSMEELPSSVRQAFPKGIVDIASCFHKLPLQ
jgi:hypothetical protein